MGLKIRRKVVNTAPLRKKMPAEVRDTMPPKIEVPAEPIYGSGPEEHALREEQQVMRVEILMTKGIRNKRQLMLLLDIKDPRQMDRFIKRVHARWEMLGTTQDHARNRGEGLTRLDLIESELWSKLQNQADDRVSVGLLGTLLNVQKQRAEMLGLTPKIIERIGTMEADALSFNRQAAVHERLSLLASRMMQMIEDRTSAKVIEHVEDRDQEG
jgi:hypothetical protein